MNRITRCPSCTTVYQLEDAHLQIAQGWLRCGACNHVFDSTGFVFSSVAKQQEPDGQFPTVAFPNPEEPGAMDLSFAHALTQHSDLIIANDPDADRLAVGVRSGNGYQMLTGDQVGLLLAEMIASANG